MTSLRLALFIAIDLQHLTYRQQLRVAAGSAVALMLCAWVVVCGTFALNESWHQQWHQLAGDPPSSETGCAIELFASGGVAPGLGYVAILIGFLGAALASTSVTASRLTCRVVAEVWQTRGPPVED